jgi:hypothetical protein
MTLPFRRNMTFDQLAYTPTESKRAQELRPNSFVTYAADVLGAAF